MTRRYGAQDRTKQDKLTALKLFLYGCRSDLLARQTPDALARMHGVDLRTCEYELTIARQKRAGEGA